MVKNAIAKLESEIKQSNNNPYIQVVGEFLLQHLNEDPAVAEKIMSKDKTIGKSLDEMRKAAAKKKVGNCAVLTDQEGFEIVLKYFGIEALSAPRAVVKETKVPASEGKAESDIDFDVKLDDLL